MKGTTMNINKAIRKQKKTYKRFVLSMGFIFVILPIVLYNIINFRYKPNLDLLQITLI